MNRAFKTYASVTLLVAATVLAVSGWQIPADSRGHWNALAAFLVLGFLTEASYLKLRVGTAETQSSVAFISFIASALLFDTGWAAATAGAAVLASESFVKRKAPIRIAFNVAQMSLSVAVGSLLFIALGGKPSLELASWELAPVPLLGAIVGFFVLNTLAVSLAVALAYGERVTGVWARIAGASIVYDLFSSLLAPLLALLYIWWQIPGILLLVLPLYFVRHLYQVTLQLEQVNRDLLELMVKAIEARDPYTSGHSQRVSQLAEVLARDLGLGPRLVEHIRTAALLHDVGKIHEEYAVLLRKEGRLDGTEKALMQTHASRSAELVGTISAFRGAITDAVRHHHENFDGSGYPSGLSGGSIPIGARIIMIADTVDAMTTDRPYRSALTFDRVAEELRRYSGSQFDPSLVEVFLRSAPVRELLGSRSGERLAKWTTAPEAPTYLPWRRFSRPSTGVRA